MRIIVWGTGNYALEKIKYISKNDLVAIADRERKEFYGKKTILIDEIDQYEYDYIFVLSNSFIEISKDLFNKGISAKKIVPGINIKPYLFNELNYKNEHVNYYVDDMTGNMLAKIDGQEIIEIRTNEDLEKVQGKILSRENKEKILELSINPINRTFANGDSIVRYYIDQFLYENRDCICGKVLEIGDRRYTKKYGEKVESECMHYDKQEYVDSSDYYGDLEKGIGVKDNYYDCIILTQVLNFVYDINKLRDNVLRSLKSGGKILLTVSGITQICRFDAETYGQYWSFTDLSIKRLFNGENVCCKTTTYGNFKTSCAFLGGLGSKDLSNQDKNYWDYDYPVIIGAVIVKE